MVSYGNDWRVVCGGESWNTFGEPHIPPNNAIMPDDCFAAQYGGT